ncbi:hypothetical protein TURU_031135 [Turdus rufiventris]|nr:hypothetical protein TURU_031135 [Turdus rufiventris]
MLSAPLSAKTSAARSETSSSGVAMCCKSPEQSRLYLPALLSSVPRNHRSETVIKMITEVVDLHGSGETWGHIHTIHIHTIHIHTIHIHTIHLQGSTLALQRRTPNPSKIKENTPKHSKNSPGVDTHFIRMLPQFPFP